METATPAMRPSDEAFQKQLEYDPASKTYTASCAVCGKVYSRKKVWYRSRDATLRKLRFQFEYCDTCGKWVCEDCSLIDDGNGNGIGICTACAKERGVKGLTSAQFDEAWAGIKEKRNKRKKADFKKIRAYNQVNRLGGTNGGDVR